MPTLDAGTGRDDVVSLDELEALRSRLPSDVRVYGAATVADIAEAVSLPESEVRDALAAIRADRAFSTPSDSGAGYQRALAGLAAVLLTTAACLFYVNWPRDPDKVADAEIANLMRQRAQRIRHKPAFVSDQVLHGGPPGVSVTILGLKSRASLAAMPRAEPMTRDAAIREIGTAVDKLTRMVAEQDAKAPADAKLLEQNSMQQQSPGSYQVTYNVFGSGGIAFLPKLDKPESVREAYSKQFAETVVAATWSSQLRRLNGSEGATAGDAIWAPPGYDISIRGRTEHGIQGGQLSLVPVDANAVRERLVQATRNLLEQDRVPSVEPYPQVNKNATKPLPPFTEVTIRGPYAAVSAKLPTGPSAKYPSAADALRASDVLLLDLAAKATKQVVRANNSGTK